MSGDTKEHDNFLNPATQAATSFMTPSTLSQTPTRPQMSVTPIQSTTPMSSGMQTGVRPPMSSTPNASSGQKFANPQPMLFNPSSMASTQSPVRPPMSFAPPMQSTTGSPAHPPTGHSGITSRRVYPEMNPQSSYTQPYYPTASAPSIPAPLGSSIYQPTSQFPTPPLNTQAAQSAYQSSPMIPSIPQQQTQPYMPQSTQQFPSYPAPGDAPVLPVVQQGEGVVPSTLIAPVQPHWFYLKDDRVWMPFSFIDSNSLEHAHR